MQIVWITLICQARGAELVKRQESDAPTLIALPSLITQGEPEIHHTSKREMSLQTPSLCMKPTIQEIEALRESIVRKTNLLDQIRAILASGLSIKSKILVIVAKILKL